MNPLEFVPPGMGLDPVAEDDPREPSSRIIPRGIRKAQRLGLIYVDPEDGVIPTVWYKILMFFASLFDITLCVIADVAYGVGISALVGISPLVRFFPAALLAQVPLWQLGALVGFLAAVSRPKVMVSIFVPGIRDYTMGLLNPEV